MRFGIILVVVLGIFTFNWHYENEVVSAAGADADAMCIKANPECGACGMLKNPQSGKCEFKGIKENPYMCPKYCYDITSGQVAAKGECIAQNKCKASECGGKECEKAKGEMPKMPELPKGMPPMPPMPPPPGMPKDCPPKDEDTASSTAQSSSSVSTISSWGDVGAASEEDCPPEDKKATSTESNRNSTESQDYRSSGDEGGDGSSIDAFRNVLDDIAARGVGGCGASLSVICPVIRALSTIGKESSHNSGFSGSGVGSGFTLMALFGGSEFGVYDSRYGLITTQDLTDLQSAADGTCDSFCMSRLRTLEQRYREGKDAVAHEGGSPYVREVREFIEPGNVTGFAPPPGFYDGEVTGFSKRATSAWRRVLDFFGF